MKLHREEHKGHCSIAIEGDLTIYSAPELKQELLDCLAGHDSVEVSLTGVGDMDSAGFQMLYLLKREAKISGKNASFVGHSPAVLEVLDIFNMAANFGDALLIPSEKLH